MNRAILVSVLLLSSIPIQAATWHVTKDGSGDFSVIQDAVDGASDGDTIVIGAGRFDDFTLHAFGKVHVWLDGTKSLSFIGAGAEATFIGPETFHAGWDVFGFKCEEGGVDLHLEGMTIQHIKGYGLRARQASINLVDCVFDRCYDAVNVRGPADHLVSTGCRFLSGEDWTSNAGGLWARDVDIHVVDTEFVIHGSGLKVTGPRTDSLISNCTFAGVHGIGGGVSLQGGADVLVENCQFTDLGVYGISVYHSGEVILRDNHIRRCSNDGVAIYGSTQLTMHGNIVEECGQCLWVGGPCDHQAIHDNHFLRNVSEDGRYAWTNTYDPLGHHYLDFTMNYWGTTNVEEIADWITDGNDSPDINLYIEFEPMADGPVQVKSHSLSRIKTLFTD